MKMRLKLYTVVTSPYIGKLFTVNICNDVHICNSMNEDILVD